VLRERLTVDEAAQLAAQLPELLRGVFYEGFDPTRQPEKIGDREEFLALLTDNRATGTRPVSSLRRARRCCAVMWLPARSTTSCRKLPAEIRDTLERG
jgi:uncharacterized protein (DUF2267 family)